MHQQLLRACIMALGVASAGAAQAVDFSTVMNAASRQALAKTMFSRAAPYVTQQDLQSCLSQFKPESQGLVFGYKRRLTGPAAPHLGLTCSQIGVTTSADAAMASYLAPVDSIRNDGQREQYYFWCHFSVENRKVTLVHAMLHDGTGPRDDVALCTPRR
jgi:hypothetical protein